MSAAAKMVSMAEREHDGVVDRLTEARKLVAALEAEQRAAWGFLQAVRKAYGKLYAAEPAPLLMESAVA